MRISDWSSDVCSSDLLRVERGGARAQTLLSNGGARYVQMLPMAWRAAGIAFGEERGVLTPALDEQTRRTGRRAWALRRAAGKPLNLLRLVKAAFTFDNGADYLALKIERQYGFRLDMEERKSVGQGSSGSVRVKSGGRRAI